MLLYNGHTEIQKSSNRGEDKEENKDKADEEEKDNKCE